MYVLLTEAGTDIGSALSTAFGGIVSDIMDAIGVILPVAMPVLGAIVVVRVGVKLFRTLTR